MHIQIFFSGQAQGDPRRAGEEACPAEEGRGGASEEGGGGEEGEGGRGEEEEAGGGGEEEAGHDAGAEGEAAGIGVRRWRRRKEVRRSWSKCVYLQWGERGERGGRKRVEWREEKRKRVKGIDVMAVAVKVVNLGRKCQK